MAIRPLTSGSVATGLISIWPEAVQRVVHYSAFRLVAHACRISLLQAGFESCDEIAATCAVAKSRKLVHSGGHQTKVGPLTKPYLIGFLGFPEPADENPSLSTSHPENASQFKL
jgi:hypothetical protein